MSSLSKIITNNHFGLMRHSHTMPCNSNLLATTLRYLQRPLSLSSQVNNLTIVSPNIKQTQQQKWYTSRAHPRKWSPEYSVPEAVRLVLDGTTNRREKRQLRWERAKEKRDKVRARGEEGIAKYGEKETPYRNQDETVELYLNMNLDPRKPGQALRGSVALPHGTGKKVVLAVFSSTCEGEDNLFARDMVTSAGATLVGGADLIQQIKDGTIPLNFTRAIATQEILPLVQKELGRMLGPRQLMPNAKTGTVLPPSASPEDISEAVQSQTRGMVNFKTDPNGIVHAPIGKASFGEEKIFDNLRTMLMAVQQNKPSVEKIGRRKQKRGFSGKGKYFLSGFLSSTQGRGIALKLRSLDPTSDFFLASPPS